MRQHQPQPSTASSFGKVAEWFFRPNSFLMKNVVIPVDFSETAALAGKFGTYLALLLNCNLEIVHVTDLVLSGEHSLTTPEQRRDEKNSGIN